MFKTLLLALTLVLAGCAHRAPPPRYAPVTEATEAEYAPYLAKGTATLSGQAFLTQQGGGVVKAAGRTVTLDPATSTGTNWWYATGRHWVHRYRAPSSTNFHNARREVTADADGRFTFTGLPPGEYFVRSEVTWEVGGYYPTQGGLVGKKVTVEADRANEVVLSTCP